MRQKTEPTATEVTTLLNTGLKRIYLNHTQMVEQAFWFGVRLVDPEARVRKALKQLLGEEES